MKCVNSLFIGVRMSSHHVFISSGILLSAALRGVWDWRHPFQSPWVSHEPTPSASPHHRSSPSYTHITSPSSTCPQHAYHHSPPHLASLSSGLGATETVTQNLNPDPALLLSEGTLATDGQPETSGQGSSPGLMLRAGWPAWHFFAPPWTEKPCSQPLSWAMDPSLQLDRGSYISLKTFVVTLQPLKGISVVIVSTLHVRVYWGLAFGNEAWCPE